MSPWQWEVVEHKLESKCGFWFLPPGRFGIEVGQVQQIFALNVARAHVIADGVTHDSARGINEQRQLWLRN